jgi:hypothetical protein
MKSTLPMLFALSLLSLQALCAAHQEKATAAGVQVSTRTLDVNRFHVQITDRGNLIRSAGRDPGGALWSWTDTSSNYIFFDQGPWIIGKSQSGLVMGNAYWGTSYVPGPVTDGRPALEVNPQDSVRFHPYKIGRNSSSGDSDVVNWPSDLGAPTGTSGKPLVLGDEVVWSVFNNADSTALPSDWQPSATFNHFPVEIQQTAYARAGSAKDTSLLANTVFYEWTFINKGPAVVESCFVGLWTDIDVGDPLNNPFGVDTITQTGYCWDGSAGDSVAFAPKAAGYTLLYGPRVPDPSSTSAIFRGKTVAGYKNLPLYSFWGMYGDYGAPSRPFPVGPNTVQEAWNIARGYDKTGNLIIDSVTGGPTRFPWSGDPLTGNGWIYNAGWTNGEAGFMFFSGPFTFAPGDTQWVMFAMLPSASRNRFEAIRAVRNNAARLHRLSYQEIAEPQVLAVTQQEGPPLGPRLSQNYPNPFNPLTVISFDCFRRCRVTLSVFSTLGQRVAELVNGDMEAGSHDVKFNAGHLASGVYFYRLQAGAFTQVRAMVLLR